MTTIKREKLVEEDLNVGTDVVWIHAPGGGELLSTQVGIHSVARGQKQYTATWSPGSIAVDSNASTTVTVPDATPGDFVLASHDKILKTDLRILGHVSATDTVKVVIHNPTTAAVTPASGTVAVVVFPTIQTVPLEGPTAEFTVDSQTQHGATQNTDVTFLDDTTGGTPPYTYSWDFGDSSPASTEQNPIHEYVYGGNNPVTYTVTLTVTDANDLTDDVSHDVEVTFWPT